MRSGSNLFLRACQKERLARPPVWIMRQAGRYLPEYRAVRAQHSFLQLCRTPALCSAVTLQPIARFDLDAAIVFSDIMMPLEAMGVQLSFNPGPNLAQPIRDAAAVDALQVPPAAHIAPFVYETIRLLRQQLAVPLIGFAGAPLTLAAYLVEGKGSKDFSTLRGLLYHQPTVAARLFDKLADSMARYACAQVEAGAQAFQLFDSWAGILDAATYRRFALPAVAHIFAALRKKGVPRIFFAQDAAALCEVLREVDCEVLGLDWRLSLPQAKAALGTARVFQGNLDPAVLLSTPEVVEAHTQALLRQIDGPHIFNLGHGILPQTPIDNVHAMLRTIRQGA